MVAEPARPRTGRAKNAGGAVLPGGPVRRRAIRRPHASGPGATAERRHPRIRLLEFCLREFREAPLRKGGTAAAGAVLEMLLNPEPRVALQVAVGAPRAHDNSVGAAPKAVDAAPVHA